jgi:hypothetical protein
VSLRGATAADDEQERPTRLLLPTRAGVCAPGSRPAWDHAVVRRGHSFLPASRATTHVVGKAIRSSRRARRGAGCWLRRTIGASARTLMSSSRMTWRRASAAHRPLIGSACPEGRRGGEGSALAHSGRSRDVRPRPPACARFRPRLAVVGTRPDGALACRPNGESGAGCRALSLACGERSLRDADCGQLPRVTVPRAVRRQR